MITSSGQITVGLDVGDKNIHACFLDQDGVIVEESKLGATPGALRRRFSSEERYRIVLEAGLHSPWMSHLLLGLGHEIYWPIPGGYGPSTKTRARATEWTPSTSLASDVWTPPLLYPLRYPCRASTSAWR